MDEVDEEAAVRRGYVSTGFAEWSPKEVVRHARRGDRDPLIAYLKEGGEVTEEVRQYLIDVLEGRGNEERKSDKVPKLATAAQMMAMSALVDSFESEGLPTGKAIKKVAKQLNKSVSSVKRARTIHPVYNEVRWVSEVTKLLGRSPPSDA